MPKIHDMRCTLPFDLPSVTYCRCGFSVQNSDMAYNLVYDRVEPPIIIPLPEGLRPAVAKRKAEFLAGRLCATMALKSHGQTASSIPMNTDRSPLWPTGFVGSISHAGGQAAAVVARATQYALLGLDLELVIPPDQIASIGSLVLKPTERILQPPHLDLQTFLTLAFSAKEALYKAIYPRIGRVLEFHDVLLKELDEATVRLELKPNSRSFNLTQFSYSVNYRIAEGECLCVVAVETDR
jgi:enterobactin synthetase component D